jgi:hypothetical protein
MDISEYRLNAEDCLHMAAVATDERDKPLWATLARSWLRLAEQVASMQDTLEDASTEQRHESSRTLVTAD